MGTEAESSTSLQDKERQGLSYWEHRPPQAPISQHPSIDSQTSLHFPVLPLVTMTTNPHQLPSPEIWFLPGAALKALLN